MSIARLFMLTALAASLTGCDEPTGLAGCSAEQGTVLLTLHGGAERTITWDPSCSLSSLSIEVQGGGDVWSVESANETNTLTSPLVYGVIPQGANGTSARPLTAGEFQVRVGRVLPDGGGWTRFGGAFCAGGNETDCEFVLREFAF